MSNFCNRIWLINDDTVFDSAHTSIQMSSYVVTFWSWILVSSRVHSL